MSETDFGGMGYDLGGAQCALHPDQPAKRTCKRCGSFMCSTCSEGGAQAICPTCQQRLGMAQAFPFNRDNWTFSALWDYCFEIFKREWVMLSVAMLVFFGIAFAVQLVANLMPAIGTALKSPVLSVILTVASVVLQQAVQGVLGLGLMQMLFDVHQGHKPDVGRIFSQVHKVGTYLLTMLIVFLIFGLPVGALAAIIGGMVAAGFESAVPVAIGLGLLAFIPFIYYVLPLTLLSPEIAYNDDVKPMQMIRNCYAYARNERLSIVGVSLVGGLVAIVGMIACCVGVIPASGLSYLLMSGLYLTLRNGADTHSED